MAKSRKLLCQRAIAPTRIDPILLEEPVTAPKINIGIGAAGCIDGAELPGTFIGVLVAATVEPCIEIGVGRGFGELMSNKVRHRIGRYVLVWSGTRVDD